MIYSFIALCIMYILLQSIHLMLWALVYPIEIIDVAVYHLFSLIKLILEQLIDLCLSVGLIGLFVNRLWILNIEVMLTSLQNNANNQMKPRQLQVIESLSKIIILSFFSIISTQIALIWDIYLYVMRQSNNDEYIDESWREFIFWQILIVTSTINVVAIVLSFDFANKSYHRICACCDYACIFLISYCSRRRVKYNELEDSLLTQNL